MPAAVYSPRYRPNPSGEVVRFHCEVDRQGGAREHTPIKLSRGTNLQPSPLTWHASFIDLLMSSNSQSHLEVREYSPTQESNPAAKHRQEIKKLAQTAHQDNWDGEGENKVSKETIEVALKLVAAFPSGVLGDDLDIDETPFGSIDFGWVLERDVMMNIIVLPSREIGFAYSIHDERDDGKVLWEGTLPRRISQAFDRVFNIKGSDG
jgi:hypothetical protein